MYSILRLMCSRDYEDPRKIKVARYISRDPYRHSGIFIIPRTQEQMWADLTRFNYV